MTSLNPLLSVGDQLDEVLTLHTTLNKTERHQRAVELLHSVKIPNPEARLQDYPHQFSGGMCQRVLIALALASEPALLLADEPTTALDVTVQAQILELLDELRQTRNMGILLITHDLGVVAEVCQRVVVMYAGHVVEQASTATLFASPQHPYTKALLASIPSGKQRGNLYSLEGIPPSTKVMPNGCRFLERCPSVNERCHSETPHLVSVETTDSPHLVNCLLFS
jgi:peptide/nickel transport system ATP-binding protein